MILAGNNDPQLPAYPEWAEVESIGRSGPVAHERGENVVEALRLLGLPPA